MTDRHASPPSPRETANRAVRAAQLAATLLKHGATAADARALPVAGRRMAEELAGTGVRSDLTWELAACFLESRAAHPSAPKPYADPFSEFPSYSA